MGMNHINVIPLCDLAYPQEPTCTSAPVAIHTLQRVQSDRNPRARAFQQPKTTSASYRQSVASANAAAMPPMPMRMFQLPSASMKGMYVPAT
jgi:hypothetical protein